MVDNSENTFDKGTKIVCFIFLYTLVILITIGALAQPITIYYYQNLGR